MNEFFSQKQAIFWSNWNKSFFFNNLLKIWDFFDLLNSRNFINLLKRTLDANIWFLLYQFFASLFLASLVSPGLKNKNVFRIFFGTYRENAKKCN